MISYPSLLSLPGEWKNLMTTTTHNKGTTDPRSDHSAVFTEGSQAVKRLTV